MKNLSRLKFISTFFYRLDYVDDFSWTPYYYTTGLGVGRLNSMFVLLRLLLATLAVKSSSVKGDEILLFDETFNRRNILTDEFINR